MWLTARALRGTARQSRNQNSEYLAQRRKDRKEIKLPDFALLASWREQILVLDRDHGPLEILRKPRKLSEFTKGLFTDGEGWGDCIQ